MIKSNPVVSYQKSKTVNKFSINFLLFSKNQTNVINIRLKEVLNPKNFPKRRFLDDKIYVFIERTFTEKISSIISIAILFVEK